MRTNGGTDRRRTGSAEDVCQDSPQADVNRCGYRRDHLGALAQRVEVHQKELRIMGSNSVLLVHWSPLQAQKRLVLACPVLYRSGRATADEDGQYCFALAL